MPLFEQKYFEENKCTRRNKLYLLGRKYYANLLKKRVPKGEKILELACSFGDLLAQLDKRYETVGIDISAHATNIARTEVTPKSTIITGSVSEKLPFDDNTFGGGIALHILEHLEEPQKTIDEMFRVLKPGGTFIFAVPNMSFIFQNCKGKSWSGPWLALRDPTHISLLQPKEWVTLLSADKWSVKKTFSDGPWDVPYFRFIPKIVQRAILGIPSAIQLFTATTFVPTFWGEALIVIAKKKG